MPTIQITTLATGSTGNCFLVSDGTCTVMLDCGLSLRKIQRGTGFALSKIDGCLLTHEHSDHSKAAQSLLNLGIPVHTSAGTAEYLDLSGYALRICTTKQAFTVGSFHCRAFTTQHDAKEPLGFLLHSTKTGEKLLFITDSFYVAHRFPPCDYIMVECNHIGDYLNPHKDRQLFARLVRSHMSLNTCKRFLLSQDLSRTKRIYLIHISKERGNPQRMQQEVARATGKEVVIA